MNLLNNPIDGLSRQDLDELMAHQHSVCLTLYLPTHRVTPAAQQDPIRLKGLLKQAARYLEFAGVAGYEMNTLLAPIESLLEDVRFWTTLSNGLAIFRSADHFGVFRIPIPFEELAFVGDRYYITPLLPMFVGDGRFALLAVSLGEIRLFSGTRFSFTQVDLPPSADSLEAATRFNVPQKSLQFQTGTPATGPHSKRPAQYHGHGAAADQANLKKQMADFLHEVDGVVNDRLSDGHPPLILAGVDYLCAMFRKVSRYPAVIDQNVSGNPEMWSPEELHRLGWEKVEGSFLYDISRAKEAFVTAHGRGNPRAVCEATTALFSAVNHRVDTLFVSQNEHIWGKLDSEGLEVSVHDEREPTDDELIDLAVTHTLLGGGTVYPLPHEEMPCDEVLAAILRY